MLSTIIERHPLPWRAHNDLTRGWVMVEADNMDVVIEKGLKGMDDLEFIAEAVRNFVEKPRKPQ